MPRIVNPFRGTDPIAQVISDLGRTMFQGTLDRDLKSESLYKAQRENAETDNLVNAIGESGSAALAASPLAHAMIVGAGYDPRKFGELGLLETATTKGARAPETQNFQVGTGQPFDNTAGAFDAKLAETRRANDLSSADRRYSVDNQLVEAVVNGMPQFARNVDAPGMQPVVSDAEAKGTMALNNFGSMGDLPPAEQNYLGADSSARTPRNYVAPDGSLHITHDGVTSAQTGQPLPAGGYIAGVEGAAKDALGSNALTLQGTNDDQGTIRRANDYFVTSKELRTLAVTNPESFGLLGSIRGNLQEAAQIIPALNSLFGGQDLNAAVQDIVQTYANKPESQGMFAELMSTYDGSLPTVRTLGVMLKYQMAAALLGQDGRDLSDGDMKRVDHMFPDPQGIFSSAQNVLNALDLFDRIMAAKRDAAMERLNAGSIAPGEVAAPAAPVEEQSGEAQEGDTVQGPDGRLYTVTGGQLVPQ